jgi:UDP-N-acetylmuramate--alanine ligase
MSRPDLGRRRGVHIVGIGGAGMSAIATVLVAMGHEVSGSDLKDGVALERLRALGVKVAIGHDAANLGAAEFLAISSAVPAGNVEVVEARRRGIAVHRRAEVLGAISSLRRTIAVSGTHGKTTTSSMLALILVEAGLSPSFIIGGEINEIGSGAVWDAGEWLVVEADESDGTFLELQSEIAVVTSVEPDHLDHYGSFEGLVAAFRRFLAAASSVAIVCGDYPTAVAVAPRDVTTYGFAADSTWRITEFAGGRSEVSFVLRVGSDSAAALALPVPGRHNALNAAGAAAAAVAVGADLEAVRRALARFGGVARRFEFRGEANGATLVDDYAHLPGEVAAALATARRGGWRRVVCVFQPHRYSRIAVLGADFADAFVDADELVVTDIYGAGEAPRPGVSGRLVVDAVRAAHPEADVTYLPRRAEIVDHLRRTLRAGDCCLTLGAGDLTSLAGDLLAGGED